MQSIIQNADDFLKLIRGNFPKKVHTLLEFGFKSLSLQRIVSLNSNARSAVANTHTAESKIYRLTKNARFVPLFPRLLLMLDLIHEQDIIAVDFSTFGDIQVLMFGKQTHNGRTLPLFFTIIIYPIDEGSQNIFIIKTIHEFLTVIEYRKVKFVFDRGFACPDIIKDLAQIEGIFFYTRIKSSKMLLFDGVLRPAHSFASGVYPVQAYDTDLLLAVTPFPEKGNAPWYIISNDVHASLPAIQHVYYYRFEIEELFRDTKRIFGLEYVHFTKPHNFCTVLWFIIAGMWFQSRLESHLYEAKSLIKKCKSSFNQSITHYWLEQIRLALQAPVLQQISIADG
jgi:hypothetical protein